MQALKSWISQCKSPGCPLPRSKGSSGAPKPAVLQNISSALQPDRAVQKGTRALSIPGLSPQLAPTDLEFGSCSLGASQPCPWEPGSPHSTTDTGCLPVCLISPSYNRITASSECSIALASPQGRHTQGLQCQTPHTPGELRGAIVAQTAAA